jgi:hypothetical protein
MTPDISYNLPINYMATALFAKKSSPFIITLMLAPRRCVDNGKSDRN